MGMWRDCVKILLCDDEKCSIDVAHTHNPQEKMVEKRALHVIAGIRMCVADATAADAVIVHNKIDTVRSMC